MFTNKASYPMKLLDTDHFGKLPNSDRVHEFISTCRDNFARFAWLITVKDRKSDTVVKALEDNIFKSFDLEVTIVSDDAKSFTLTVIKNIR